MTAKPAPRKRIDALAPGEEVVLRYHGPSDYDEPATFLRIDGEGDDRSAWFESANEDGSTYTWAAYRHNGSWAYGSSAHRLSLVHAPADDRPRKGDLFRHPKYIDPAWRPTEPGQTYRNDAPRVLCVVTKVEPGRVYYRYADEAMFPGIAPFFTTKVKSVLAWIDAYESEEE